MMLEKDEAPNRLRRGPSGRLRPYPAPLSIVSPLNQSQPHIPLLPAPPGTPTHSASISFAGPFAYRPASIISDSSKIKRVPSTPTFKQSAAVIYEEQVILRNEEDISTNEDSSTGGAPIFFELNDPPKTSLKRGNSKIMIRSYTKEESISDHETRHRLSSRRSAASRSSATSISDATDGMAYVLSAMYAKILVIIGLCFPMAEVISHRIPIGWYEGFYLYLFLGSVLFLMLTFATRRRIKKKKGGRGCLTRLRKLICWSSSETGSESVSANISEAEAVRREARLRIKSASDSSLSQEDHISRGPLHFGSFYLRLGAVAFGIGSMIYSGLEFGQFFELESKEHCYSFLYGFTPSAHMAFTFFQLYFIFMNSRALISKHNVLGSCSLSSCHSLPFLLFDLAARFGLMHMIATNLCVWLHVLIQETKHQIMIVVNPNMTHQLMPEFANSWSRAESMVEDLSEDYLDTFEGDGIPVTHVVSKRSIGDHESVTHGLCRRSNVIGQLVQDASQFLFPCTIEYSLICAAVLYMMWKYTGDEK